MAGIQIKEARMYDHLDASTLASKYDNGPVQLTRLEERGCSPDEIKLLIVGCDSIASDLNDNDINIASLCDFARKFMGEAAPNPDNPKRNIIPKNSEEWTVILSSRVQEVHNTVSVFRLSRGETEPSVTESIEYVVALKEHLGPKTTLRMILDRITDKDVPEALAASASEPEVAATEATIPETPVSSSEPVIAAAPASTPVEPAADEFDDILAEAETKSTSALVVRPRTEIQVIVDSLNDEERAEIEQKMGVGINEMADSLALVNVPIPDKQALQLIADRVSGATPGNLRGLVRAVQDNDLTFDKALDYLGVLDELGLKPEDVVPLDQMGKVITQLLERNIAGSSVIEIGVFKEFAEHFDLDLNTADEIENVVGYISRVVQAIPHYRQRHAVNPDGSGASDAMDASLSLNDAIKLAQTMETRNIEQFLEFLEDEIEERNAEPVSPNEEEEEDFGDPDDFEREDD